jgi:hypothetical protein
MDADDVLDVVSFLRRVVPRGEAEMARLVELLGKLEKLVDKPLSRA